MVKDLIPKEEVQPKKNRPSYRSFLKEKAARRAEKQSIQRGDEEPQISPNKKSKQELSIKYQSRQDRKQHSKQTSKQQIKDNKQQSKQDNKQQGKQDNKQNHVHEHVEKNQENKRDNKNTSFWSTWGSQNLDFQAYKDELRNLVSCKKTNKSILLFSVLFVFIFVFVYAIWRLCNVTNLAKHQGDGLSGFYNSSHSHSVNQHLHWPFIPNRNMSNTVVYVPFPTKFPKGLGGTQKTILNGTISSKQKTNIQDGLQTQPYSKEANNYTSQTALKSRIKDNNLYNKYLNMFYGGNKFDNSQQGSKRYMIPQNYPLRSGGESITNGNRDPQKDEGSGNNNSHLNGFDFVLLRAKTTPKPPTQAINPWVMSNDNRNWYYNQNRDVIPVNDNLRGSFNPYLDRSAQAYNRLATSYPYNQPQLRYPSLAQERLSYLGLDDPNVVHDDIGNQERPFYQNQLSNMQDPYKYQSDYNRKSLNSDTLNQAMYNDGDDEMRQTLRATTDTTAQPRTYKEINQNPPQNVTSDSFNAHPDAKKNSEFKTHGMEGKRNSSKFTINVVINIHGKNVTVPLTLNSSDFASIPNGLKQFVQNNKISTTAATLPTTRTTIAATTNATTTKITSTVSPTTSKLNNAELPVTFDFKTGPLLGEKVTTSHKKIRQDSKTSSSPLEQLLKIMEMLPSEKSQKASSLKDILVEKNSNQLKESFAFVTRAPLVESSTTSSPSASWSHEYSASKLPDDVDMGLLGRGEEVGELENSDETKQNDRKRKKKSRLQHVREKHKKPRQRKEDRRKPAYEMEEKNFSKHDAKKVHSKGEHYGSRKHGRKRKNQKHEKNYDSKRHHMFEAIGKKLANLKTLKHHLSSHLSSISEKLKSKHRERKVKNKNSWSRHKQNNKNHQKPRMWHKEQVSIKQCSLFKSFTLKQLVNLKKETPKEDKNIYKVTICTLSSGRRKGHKHKKSHYDCHITTYKLPGFLFLRKTKHDKAYQFHLYVCKTKQGRHFLESGFAYESKNSKRAHVKHQRKKKLLIDDEGKKKKRKETKAKSMKQKKRKEDKKKDKARKQKKRKGKKRKEKKKKKKTEKPKVKKIVKRKHNVREKFLKKKSKKNSDFEKYQEREHSNEEDDENTNVKQLRPAHVPRHHPKYAYSIEMPSDYIRESHGYHSKMSNEDNDDDDISVEGKDVEKHKDQIRHFLAKRFRLLNLLRHGHPRLMSSYGSRTKSGAKFVPDSDTGSNQHKNKERKRKRNKFIQDTAATDEDDDSDTISSTLKKPKTIRHRHRTYLINKLQSLKKKDAENESLQLDGDEDGDVDEDEDEVIGRVKEELGKRTRLRGFLRGRKLKGHSRGKHVFDYDRRGEKDEMEDDPSILKKRSNDQSEALKEVDDDDHIGDAQKDPKELENDHNSTEKTDEDITSNTDGHGIGEKDKMDKEEDDDNNNIDTNTDEDKNLRIDSRGKNKQYFVDEDKNDNDDNGNARDSIEEAGGTIKGQADDNQKNENKEDVERRSGIPELKDNVSKEQADDERNPDREIDAVQPDETTYIKNPEDFHSDFESGKSPQNSDAEDDGEDDHLQFHKQQIKNRMLLRNLEKDYLNDEKLAPLLDIASGDDDNKDGRLQFRVHHGKLSRHPYIDEKRNELVDADTDIMEDNLDDDHLSDQEITSNALARKASRHLSNVSKNHRHFFRKGSSKQQKSREKLVEKLKSKLKRRKKQSLSHVKLNSTKKNPSNRYKGMLENLMDMMSNIREKIYKEDKGPSGSKTKEDRDGVTKHQPSKHRMVHRKEKEDITKKSKNHLRRREGSNTRSHLRRSKSNEESVKNIVEEVVPMVIEKFHTYKDEPVIPTLSPITTVMNTLPTTSTSKIRPTTGKRHMKTPRQTRIRGHRPTKPPTHRPSRRHTKKHTTHKNHSTPSPTNADRRVHTTHHVHHKSTLKPTVKKTTIKVTIPKPTRKTTVKRTTRKPTIKKTTAKKGHTIANLDLIVKGLKALGIKNLLKPSPSHKPTRHKTTPKNSRKPRHTPTRTKPMPSKKPVRYKPSATRMPAPHPIPLRHAHLLRIVCFGDSLTAGYYHHGKAFYPYGDRLNTILNQNSRIYASVQTKGIVGEMTHKQMTGRLPQVLGNSSEVDWVIILGGTNDILHVKNFADDQEFLGQLENVWQPRISKDIEKLHKISYNYGAHTLLLTIPENAIELWPGYKILLSMRKKINEELRRFANASKGKTVLCDLAKKFPRHSLSPSMESLYWDDHLHMTPAGYNRMAEIVYNCLKPYIPEISSV